MSWTEKVFAVFDEPVTSLLRAIRFPGLKIMLHGPPATSGSITLTHDRIFLFLSRYGILFLLLCLSMLLGSFNYYNNLGFFFTFSLGAMGLVSLLHTYRNLSGLVIKPGRTEPAFAGETAAFNLLVHNNRNHDKFSISLKTTNSANSDLSFIGPDSKAQARLFIPALSRGYLSLGQVTVSTNFPLGLFRAWSKIRPEIYCLVYPSPAEYSSHIDYLLDSHAGEKEGKSNIMSGVDEFRELKEYTSAHSYKRIDWKAYARDQGLMVKEFSSGALPDLWFDFQQVPGQDKEEKLSRLCRLVLQAHKKQISYGLKLPGQEIQPSTGEEHKHECLKALALF